MAKTFTVLKSDVGNLVQDTSTALATLIEGWLNDGYRDVWRRCLWSEIINDDYTITLVSGTQPYNLPADFDEEIFVADKTDGFSLARSNEGNWWRERTTAYSGGTISNGTSVRYVILKEKMQSDYKGIGVIMFDPTPNNTHVIAMPYKRKWTPFVTSSGTCTTNTADKIIASASTFITTGYVVGMIIKNTTDSTYGRISSVDSETQLTMDWDVCPDGNETFEIYTYPQILDIEEILEMYAASQAQAYKRQYQKAMYWGNRYETLLARRIGQERNKINQSYQWIPEQRDSYNVMPFTGWESYDSLT